MHVYSADADARSRGVNDVGGHRQPKMRGGMWPGQDSTGRYAKSCAALAADLNWDEEDVCFYWSQIALVREKHNKEPRAMAEFFAMENVREALDCRGREPS